MSFQTIPASLQIRSALSPAGVDFGIVTADGVPLFQCFVPFTQWGWLTSTKSRTENLSVAIHTRAVREAWSALDGPLPESAVEGEWANVRSTAREVISWVMRESTLPLPLHAAARQLGEAVSAHHRQRQARSEDAVGELWLTAVRLIQTDNPDAPKMFSVGSLPGYLTTAFNRLRVAERTAKKTAWSQCMGAARNIPVHDLAKVAWGNEPACTTFEEIEEEHKEETEEGATETQYTRLCADVERVRTHILNATAIAIVAENTPTTDHLAEIADAVKLARANLNLNVPGTQALAERVLRLASLLGYEEPAKIATVD